MARRGSRSATVVVVGARVRASDRAVRRVRVSVTTVASAPPVAIARNGRIVASVRAHRVASVRVHRVATVRALCVATVRVLRAATVPAAPIAVRGATIREGPVSSVRAARASRRE